MASHGRYTIKGKLADGGMAEIFLAVQHGAEGFEKPVVLKRILTAYSADPQFRNMMLDEAHISMGLQHSNIAQILDLGVAGGRYFLALELVDGWDLEQILQRAYAAGMVWPAALALHVCASVCRALAYAHGKSKDGKPLGIVHRDISPQQRPHQRSGRGEADRLRRREGPPQARADRGRRHQGQGRVHVPRAGAGGTVDRRSDIFSVGSMLYRMMTDKLPFEAGSDMDSLIRVQKAEFKPPDQVRPTVSPAVSAIIMRAMRLGPAERYQTADEMLADVERALRSEFHSAGQTELKLWLEQLSRRDSVPSIGRRPLISDTGGTVKDVVDTDLSAGTSFELDDFDMASSQTALATSNPRLVQPPPLPPMGGATAEVKVRDKPRRRSGFWFGVVFALAAVIGARYLINWAEREGVVDKLGLGTDAALPGPTIAPAPAPTPSAPPPPTVPAAPPAPVAPAPAPVVAAATDAAAALPVAAAPVDAAAAPPPGKPPEPVAETPPEKPPQKPDEQDEEALLKDVEPDAEHAVIGDDEAEAPAKPAKATAKQRPTKAPPPSAPAKPETKQAAKPDTTKPDTAVLHFVTAPAGAIVKTKARILGRTPINLHFRTGNTYEVVFVKNGYQTATRKLTVSGTKDKKISVTLLKKRAPAKRSFFRPHR